MMIYPFVLSFYDSEERYGGWFSLSNDRRSMIWAADVQSAREVAYDRGWGDGIRLRQAF